MAVALIIEDEPDICKVFAWALQQVGYETSIVRSGDKALEWLSADVPDLVILDLSLPVLPGTEIIKHMRGDTRLKDVPVIVASAHPRMAESVRTDVDSILIKPVMFDQLRSQAARFIAGASRDGQRDAETGEDPPHA